MIARALIPLLVLTAVVPPPAGTHPVADRSAPVDPGAGSMPGDTTDRRGPRTETDPPVRFSARADSMVRSAVEDGELPGAALVLVDGGEMELARGYGVADLEDGTPVSARTTRFSVGSVSKLVTALAVLQLVEGGRLSLDADVGRHPAGDLLPPGPEGEDATLHHLLTHTSGLEPAQVGLAAHSPPAADDLRQDLSTLRPARPHPPGRLYLYSQFGYGLAGLIVAERAGQPFASYVREHVFDPLGMERSTFRQEALSGAESASGYYLDGSDTIPASTAYHRIPPAGGLVTTPADLARLAAALLRGGALGDSARVLPDRMVRRMLSRQWSPHPRPEVEGTAYGLFEHRACGLRALTTRGWVGGHSTYLHLVPARGAGFVVVANASSLAGLEPSLRRALHRALAGGDCKDAGAPGTADREAPATPGREGGADGSDGAEPFPGGPPDPTELFGHYRGIGYADHGVEALGRYLLAPQISVGPGPEGTVVELGDARVAAEPVAPRLLRASWAEGQADHFAFVRDDRGEVHYMMWGGIAYERVPPYRTRAATTMAALLLAGIFLAGAIAPAAGFLLARIGRDPDEATSSALSTWLHRSSAAISVLGLAFAAVMALHLGVPDRYRFAFGVPTAVRAALWIPFVMLAGGVGLGGGTALAWLRGEGPVWGRILWAVVAAAGAATGAAALAVGLVP